MLSQTPLLSEVLAPGELATLVDEALKPFLAALAEAEKTAPIGALLDPKNPAFPLAEGWDGLCQLSGRPGKGRRSVLNLILYQRSEAQITVAFLWMAETGLGDHVTRLARMAIDGARMKLRTNRLVLQDPQVDAKVWQILSGSADAYNVQVDPTTRTVTILPTKPYVPPAKASNAPPTSAPPAPPPGKPTGKKQAGKK